MARLVSAVANRSHQATVRVARWLALKRVHRSALGLAQQTNDSYCVPDGPSPLIVSVCACDRALPMPDQLASAVRQNTMNLRRTQSHTERSGTVRLGFPFPWRFVGRSHNHDASGSRRTLAAPTDLYSVMRTLARAVVTSQLSRNPDPVFKPGTQVSLSASASIARVVRQFGRHLPLLSVRMLTAAWTATCHGRRPSLAVRGESSLSLQTHGVDLWLAPLRFHCLFAWRS
jgi:hypothetical protein